MKRGSGILIFLVFSLISITSCNFHLEQSEDDFTSLFHVDIETLEDNYGVFVGSSFESFFNEHYDRDHPEDQFIPVIKAINDIAGEGEDPRRLDVAIFYSEELLKNAYHNHGRLLRLMSECGLFGRLFARLLPGDDEVIIRHLSLYRELDINCFPSEEISRLIAEKVILFPVRVMCLPIRELSLSNYSDYDDMAPREATITRATAFYAVDTLWQFMERIRYVLSYDDHNKIYDALRDFNAFAKVMNVYGPDQAPDWLLPLLPADD